MRRYEPLVQRVVWRLRLPPGCDREDLAQEARLGLLAAIRAWRPERGPFPAFADRCVSNQALLALKAAAARKHQVLSLAASIDSPHDGHANPSDDRRAPALLDVLAARRDTCTDPELRLLVHEQLVEPRARPPRAHRQRARRARDGIERTEPDAARRRAPRLPARRFAGGLPRAPEARGCPLAGRLTRVGRRFGLGPKARKVVALARRPRWSEPGWMALDETGRPGSYGAPPRACRRWVGRVPLASGRVEVDARDLDVGVACVRVDRHPLPRPRVADALEIARHQDATAEQALPEARRPTARTRSPTSSRNPARRSPPPQEPRQGSGWSGSSSAPDRRGRRRSCRRSGRSGCPRRSSAAPRPARPPARPRRRSAGSSPSCRRRAACRAPRCTTGRTPRSRRPGRRARRPAPASTYARIVRCSQGSPPR